LLYAELLQSAGRPAEALAVVRQLTWGPAVAMSAADLMAALGDWDGVISVTENIPTNNDWGVLIWVFRARAYRMKGMLDAAAECLKTGCSARVHDASVRAVALLERAELNVAQGHFSAAQRDVEHVLATDSTDPVAQALLARLVGNKKDEVDSH
jgi:predicted Zn-dependent protease